MTIILGLAAILAAPMMLIIGLRSGFTQGAGDSIDAVLGFMFLFGWACSLLGLHRLARTRGAPAWNWLVSVQTIGLLLAASQQVQDFVGHPAWRETLFYRICDIAWPFSVTFMLVTGGYAAAKRLLDGWGRWTPLLCGLTLPVLIAVTVAVSPRAGLIAFGVYTTIAWALLGDSIRRQA